MSLNLYEALGVGAKASDAQIIYGFRIKARDCHPDLVDGRREEFDAIALARDVLLDPARRAHYDATGEAVPLQPDKSYVALMTTLSGAFSEVMSRLMQNKQDPAGGDMIGAMRSVLEAQRKNAEAQVQTATECIWRVGRAAGRFRSSDPTLQERLNAVSTSQKDGFDQAVKMAQEQIVAIDLALASLVSCRYEANP